MATRRYCPATAAAVPPVRNGEKAIRRTLNGVLGQTFEDIEIVISDNASSDQTQLICEEYASRDARVRYLRNETDVGQIENFNSVLRRAHGEYFRWIGTGDQIDPCYASLCVAELDRHEDFIGVTSEFQFRGPGGELIYEPFHGKRMESKMPLCRLARFLWFSESNRGFFDPIYGTFRRHVLMDTALLQINVYADHLLALEICLCGPFRHLEAVLATRSLPEFTDNEALAQRCHPSLAGQGTRSKTRLLLERRRVIIEMGWGARRRLVAYGLLVYYRCFHSGRRLVRKLRRMTRWRT